METSQNYIRPLRPWVILTADISDILIVFERTIYNQDKKADHKITEQLDFSQTDISEYIRLCFIAYIILGKLSPSHAQRIITEYKIHLSEAGNHKTPDTPREFLSLLSIKLPGVFDDSMQGVLTQPFHENLFGKDKTLMDALEFVHDTQEYDYKELFVLYFKTYTKCRQYIIDIALSMARDIPSLTDAEIHSGEEFFSWWRRQCNQEIRINISKQSATPLFLPDIPEKSSTMITKVIQEIANDYGRLARLLGRPEDAVKDFIQAFVIELNEGMVNLPLNQYGRGLCPAAKTLEINIKSSTGYPTIAPYVKEVHIAGHILEDAFKRFFAVKYKKFLLPRTQAWIILSQLGGCPFPDYGFMELDAENAKE